ncbi:MAG: sugar ABC transporter permease [Rhizobiaceae bacterium]|nr:sugar ABC transporter permease [Rhizobiaceae bacterium]
MRINPAYYFLAPAFMGLSVFKIFPIGVAIVGSFYGTTLIGESVFRGLDNYLSIFGDLDLLRSFGITLLFNLIANPLQIVLSLMVALLVFRPGPLIGLFRSVLFLPVTLSLVLTALIWNLLLDPYLGPVNAVLDAVGIGRQGFFKDEAQALGSMVWLTTWRGVGYWMLFMLAGLYAIPESLYEAAKIDGASWWQRFRHVTLPLMRRPIAFVLVASTAINMLFFAPVYVITAGGPNGATDFVMFRIYQAAFNYIDVGRSLAMSTVMLVVVLAVAIVELWLMRSED